MKNGKHNHSLIYTIIVLIAIFLVILQDYYLINKIRSERNQEIIELENKMRNMQSRINFNSKIISEYIGTTTRR